MKSRNSDNGVEIPIMPSLNNASLLRLANQLLMAVKDNNQEEIIRLVSAETELLKYQYPAFDHQNILIIACNDHHSMDSVRGTTIQNLINLGATCNEPSNSDHWEAIHYTALNANREKMEVVIKNLSKDEINSLVYCSKHVLQKYSFSSDNKIQKTYSNNALSIILKFGNRNNQFFECCELLIDSGIDVNQADSNGVTPSDLIWRLRIDKLSRLLKGQSFFQGTIKTSFGLLRLNSFDRFLGMIMSGQDANAMDSKDENLSSCTLLQMCCAKGFTSGVRHLLEKGALLNKTIKKNPEHPLMTAINGYHEDIVTLFLQRPDLILPDDILLKLQMLHNNKKKIPTLDKWMKMILKHMRQNEKKSPQRYLIVKDDLERTVLHYSVHYKCTDTTLALLSMGASLLSEDLFGYTPLDSIEANVLEKFFNDCVSVIPDEADPSNLLQIIKNKANQFSMRIGYENFVPRREDTRQESEFLDHMIKVTNLNHLLNHPVVASYLALKWDKFKWWVYFNLSLYCIAYISLLLDGFVLSTTVRTSNVLLWVAYALLISRDFIHILILRWKYIKRTETIIDFFLIGSVTYVILSTWLPRLNNQNLLVACSVVFLTSTLGIFTQLGNLSHFTVKVTMLKQISINFFKAMAFYMFPVLAFFFSFYMLNETKSSKFFKLLFDTITIYAGDADSEFPDQFTTNPIFGHIVYLVFVVFIGIILHNLLVGLAVSDLQDIQKEAQFISKREQAKYIVNIEKIIFQQFRRSYFLKKMFHKLLSCLHVFGESRVLVIQSHNMERMYIKGQSGTKKRIRDQEIVLSLQKIYKSLTLDDKSGGDVYSIKNLLKSIAELKGLVTESIEASKSGRGDGNSLVSSRI